MTGGRGCARIPRTSAMPVNSTLNLMPVKNHILIDKADKTMAADINAASDLFCGAALARTRLEGRPANVRINIPAIKDRAIADEQTRSVDALEEDIAK